MKTLFVETIRKTSEKELETIDTSVLPKKIFIAYSIQYSKTAVYLKNKLGKQVMGFSQVLGCSILNSEFPILLIGSGRFHAINLALQNSSVYILEGTKISQIDQVSLERIRKQEKGKYSKFLYSDRIGILVSTKSGQEHFAQALAFSKSTSKDSYLFIADNINISELENFAIDYWVNTSCPGLSRDSEKIIDIRKLKK